MNSCVLRLKILTNGKIMQAHLLKSMEKSRLMDCYVSTRQTSMCLPTKKNDEKTSICMNSRYESLSKHDFSTSAS